MKPKHAAEIRAGILFARSHMPRPGGNTIARLLNSRYYSELTVYAINEYTRRHYPT